MIPYEEFKVGQQVKIFDRFEDSYWDEDEVACWDEDDDAIWGVLGKILTIKSLEPHPEPGHITFISEEGYEVFAEDVEYIVGGYGDLVGEVEPVAEPVTALLFG